MTPRTNRNWKGIPFCWQCGRGLFKRRDRVWAVECSTQEGAVGVHVSCAANVKNKLPREKP